MEHPGWGMIVKGKVCKIQKGLVAWHFADELKNSGNGLERRTPEH